MISPPIAVLVYVLVHAVIEACYLLAAGPTYKQMIQRIQGPGRDTRSERYLFAFFAYLAFFAATFYIVVRPILWQSNISTKEALLSGFFFGLAVYGVYNLTNLYLFRDYGYASALIDIIYGTLSITLIAFLALAARRRLR